MKIGGDAAFWVKVAIGVAALYVVWKAYRGAAAVVESVAGAARKVGEVVEGAGQTIGEAVTRPASVEEGEGASAPGYGP